MGIAARQRNVNDEEQSEIHSLFDWISQMRRKKMKYLCNRRRNIRVEAVLAHALTHAERDLRKKQIDFENNFQEKKRRRMEVKQSTESVMEVMMENSCNEAAAAVPGDHNDNDWLEMCPELSSLDYFMSQLSEIKEPVYR
ncbi:hypothetical protein PV325_002633 [Microctonus aethiopoides]|uniref:Uncharacterized protein n=1 Tax=Microctonus aethiopoides TaxID=144406 RepID=A0AA39KJP5_9HYME|nr:hypothetical protein PV325_002633 [Microctonus aethiopoides]KAK0096951.1 hypothetical protein PV326_003753 [Microctonus aethiopoides]KAK0163841.1 hypothetical protein PV328_002530 [Microctonus aethiopoides]